MKETLPIKYKAWYISHKTDKKIRDESKVGYGPDIGQARVNSTLYLHYNVPAIQIRALRAHDYDVFEVSGKDVTREELIKYLKK